MYLDALVKWLIIVDLSLSDVDVLMRCSINEGIAFGFLIMNVTEDVEVSV